SRAAPPPCCKPSRPRSFLYRAEPRLPKPSRSCLLPAEPPRLNWLHPP
uniref:Uncharacterized protein n=1 Tax=Cucumis melo TaxID=3656 RepID=A0A9I9E442_CUCME